MKRYTIAYPNAKGQVVIPKAYRDELDINDSTPLSIQLSPGMIMIFPLPIDIPYFPATKTYSDILRETRGAWGPESREEKATSKKRQISELKLSAQRRKAW